MAVDVFNHVIDRINAERLSGFLRLYNLSTSGSKPDLVARVKSAVEANVNGLTLERFEEFIADEISHGKSRTLFVSYVDPRLVRRLISETFVVTSLNEQGGCGTSDFNDLRNSVDPDESWCLCYRKVSTRLQVVEKIDLCFVKATMVDFTIQTDDGEQIQKRQQTEYTWSVIYPQQEKIIIKVWNRQGNAYETMGKSRILHDEVLEMVCNIFGLTISRKVIDTKAILYKMFKDLTETAEKPFREQVDGIATQINQFAVACAQQLGLPGASNPINLPLRLHRLLERALIQHDLDGYKSFFDGKRGVVDRIAFSDPTGAFVNARSGEFQEGIEVADIYFDTRDTIEELKMLDKLWVSWFQLCPGAMFPERIETKVEVCKDYYIIQFLYAYTTREVEEHVLSNFRYYETLPD